MHTFIGFSLEFLSEFSFLFAIWMGQDNLRNNLNIPTESSSPPLSYVHVMFLFGTFQQDNILRPEQRKNWYGTVLYDYYYYLLTQAYCNSKYLLKVCRQNNFDQRNLKENCGEGVAPSVCKGREVFKSPWVRFKMLMVLRVFQLNSGAAFNHPPQQHMQTPCESESRIQNHTKINELC